MDDSLDLRHDGETVILRSCGTCLVLSCLSHWLTFIKVNFAGAVPRNSDAKKVRNSMARLCSTFQTFQSGTSTAC